jgi:hypothetical protein
MVAALGLEFGSLSLGDAFTLEDHRTILMDALHRGSFHVHDKEMSFSADAVGEIDAENGALDRGSLVSYDPRWHFDNEEISSSSQRLLETRRKLLKELGRSVVSVDVHKARALIGRATHLISDFYAHTNWIELGNARLNRDLGVGELSTPIAGTREATCRGDGMTLVDAGLTKLTSGYYAGPLSCELPASKCRHGGNATCPLGISKDAKSAVNHDKAKQMAKEAVQMFVNDVINAARTSIGTARRLMGNSP